MHRSSLEAGKAAGQKKTQFEMDSALVSYYERQMGRVDLSQVVSTTREGVAYRGEPADAGEMHIAATQRRSWLKYIGNIEMLGDVKKSYRGLFKVSWPHGVYTKLGLPHAPFLYSYEHARLATEEHLSSGDHRHGLSECDLKLLPELLARPVAILNSSTRNDSLLAILNATDSQGRILIAAIRVTNECRYHGKVAEANIITSFYGKGNEFFIRQREGVLKISAEVVYQDLVAGTELDTLTGREGFFGKPLAKGLRDKQVFRKPKCVKLLEESRARERGEAVEKTPRSRGGRPGDTCRHANLAAANRSAPAINLRKKLDGAGPGNEER